MCIRDRYVDNSFPEAWKAPIKEGVLAWNKAFEAIGLKDVMQVRDFPTAEEDPQFDQRCIRDRLRPAQQQRSRPFAFRPDHPQQGLVLEHDADRRPCHGPGIFWGKEGNITVPISVFACFRCPTAEDVYKRQQQQRLLDEQQRLYAERAKLKKEVKQLETIKSNVDTLSLIHIFTPPRIAPSRPFKEKKEVTLYPASASSQAAAPHGCYSSPVVAHSLSGGLGVGSCVASQKRKDPQH